MKQININRQLLGIEDLLFGFGQVTQNRAGQSVNITKINAGNLPFDETQSLIQWAQNVNLAELGAMTTELQALYDSIDALNNLEDNLVALNTLAQAINCLNNLCDNLTKLQNIDTNMTKLQNIDTNMTKLQNIDTNMAKLQNIDTNMDKLSSIYNNMSMLQAIYDNMSNLNAINTQIIPHLNEILLVDDYAAQVSADKTTVANDKASVASMKLAVETIYDTFDDRFLGTKTSDPTLDNDGNPLLDGAMYFNTSVNALKVYDLGNALWVTIPQIYLSGLLDVTLTSITTGDILTWNGSKWINTRTPSFDSIKLNGGTGTNGTATWNNAEYTYDIVLNPNVTLQVGQEDLVYCKNNTASIIANGRPVMAVGTNGNSGNILVDLHDGTKANARRIIGIATEDLTANGYGFVTRNGKVRGINTTGSQYGETWVNGDILYVKATGNLTNVEPVDTALKMPIAFVIHAHTNGTLYVRTTGIDENHDRDLIATKVSKVTSTDNAIVRFDLTSGQIQNSGVIIDDSNNVIVGGTTTTFTSGVSRGIAIEPTAPTSDSEFRVNGSGSWFTSFSSNASGAGFGGWRHIGSTGSIKNWVYTAGSGELQFGTNGAERMRIDANGNIGIGTSNPSVRLDINSTTNTVARLAAPTGNYSAFSLLPNGSGSGLSLGAWADSSVSMYNQLNSYMAFGTNNTERMRIDANGIVIINKGVELKGETKTHVIQTDSNVGGSNEFRIARYTTAGVYEDIPFRITPSGNVGIGVTPANTEKLQVKTGTNRNLGISDQTTITGAVTIEGIDDTRGANIPVELRGSTVSITRPAGTTAVFDASGNVGIGVTPSAWQSGITALNLGNAFIHYGGGTNFVMGVNAYANAGYKYKSAGYASNYTQQDGAHYWFIAPSGTAGNAITWTQAMSLDSSGNLLVGTTSQLNGARLNIVIGSGSSNYASFSSDHIFYNCTAGGVNASSTAYSVQRISATGRSINAAGTINASGADYAEYEYSDDINLVKGQIVGFKEDGTLTDRYSESIRFAIKSTNPSIVGGDVWGCEEIVGKRPERPVKTEEMSDEEFAKLEEQYEKDLADFEVRLETERQKVDRIAYAGKVPVNVYGAVAGQYVIAIEKEDGTIDGKLVNKVNMTFSEYQDAVGRVNKILDDGRAEVAVIIH